MRCCTNTSSLATPTPTTRDLMFPKTADEWVIAVIVVAAIVVHLF